MAATLKNKVIKQAKEDAELFYNEWREPLNPAKTDWDAEAWQATVRQIKIPHNREDELWPVYQDALVAETRRLSK